MVAPALAGVLPAYSLGGAKYRTQMAWPIRNSNPAIAETQRRKNEMWIGTSCPQGLLAHSTMPILPPVRHAYRETRLHNILQPGEPQPVGFVMRPITSVTCRC